MRILDESTAMETYEICLVGGNPIMEEEIIMDYLIVDNEITVFNVQSNELYPNLNQKFIDDLDLDQFCEDIWNELVDAEDPRVTQKDSDNPAFQRY